MEQEQEMVAIQIKVPMDVYLELLRLKGKKQSWFEFLETLVMAEYELSIKKHKADMKNRVEELEGEINDK